MEWRSSDGRVILLLGDSVEMIPRLKELDVAAVATDPPYGCSYVGSPGTTNKKSLVYSKPGGIRTREKVEGDDVPFDPSPWIGWPCVMTGAQWYYDRLPAGGSLHCWNKRGGYRPMCQGDADMIWCSRRMPPRVFGLVWRGICRHSEYLDRIEHPTQKPVALMSWMMGLLGIAGTVLDPYMGSGTTGIACLRTGRRFIGVEKLRRYFEVAKNRLEAELRKLSPIFMLEEEGCWDSSI